MELNDEQLQYIVQQATKSIIEKMKSDIKSDMQVQIDDVRRIALGLPPVPEYTEEEMNRRNDAIGLLKKNNPGFDGDSISTGTLEFMADEIRTAQLGGKKL